MSHAPAMSDGEPVPAGPCEGLRGCIAFAKLLLAMGIATVAASGCDPGATPLVENTAAVPVVVSYAYGPDFDFFGGGFGERLAPGASFRLTWIGEVPSRVRIMLKARDAANDEVVFCRIYSLDDPNIRNLKIVIREGEIDCPEADLNSP